MEYDRVVYNEFIKQAVGKNLGDIVRVTLENDTKKREVKVPAHIESILKDAGVLDLFMKQPDYLKREQINHIEIAKKEEARTSLMNTLTKRLNVSKQPVASAAGCC